MVSVRLIAPPPLKREKLLLLSNAFKTTFVLSSLRSRDVHSVSETDSKTTSVSVFCCLVDQVSDVCVA